ncbi:hypothetical protein MUK42_30430 [Musa troglodytarum]|uniref:DUF4378 domain-containing protein n=1 Tax=Musa troglodytarum TaxID=320322 RepID=A0A9E7FE85_9LILI|nr:hypothetical protein MUK42_30430 [Musa troglodytarum]URD94670.1 hypothetical protein MUK42_30430 [Musa troglodytarum]URD94671.1 hypothetical protein MUK42_30430 [Musa troglodytarum]URD94672.1 hypothetical protein MUK42_30430 [Musa troglodytarum]URD94673.1 hypothetical protein MUK42_30430 [Musa troglodytarum]
MSAKFLHTFADEDPELKRQIGCMTGIFQIFDRQRLLTGRRLRGRSHQGVSSGKVISSRSSVGTDGNGCSPHTVLERSLSKSLNENQRVSVESSRTSFSSSSCSSFSSLDCNKSSQEEHPSVERIYCAQRSVKDSPKLKSHEVQTDCRSLDFQDVVKDSMYEDAQQPLSVRTSLKEGTKNHTLKHKDSPRPILLSKSMDASHTTEIDGRSRVHIDLGESLRVLAKLKKAPWYFSEAGEPPRKSYEAKDTSFYPLSKEAPRFSYDGRDSRSSLDSRESSKISSKLRELPRLSLDGRECSNTTLKEFDRGSINRRADIILEHQQEPGSCKRPHSIVAKLMGLEAEPNSQEQVVLPDTNSNKKFDHFNRQKSIGFASKQLTNAQDCKEDLLSCSRKCSIRDPAIPLQKRPTSIIKPVFQSRVPIEPAPWRHNDKICIPQKMTFVPRERQIKKQSESVYSEIEKRLKELEFQQSNKDLRALKHILDAMHAKGLLETENTADQPSKTSVSSSPSGSAQNVGMIDAQNTIGSHPTFTKGDKTSRAFDSPIVIMKPAKSFNGLDISPSSVIPLEGLSGLRRLRTSNPVDKKKASVSVTLQKDQTPKAYRETTCQPPLSEDKKFRKEENGTQKNCMRMSQVSPRLKGAPREDNGSSVKASNSLSPRLQLKKLEMEKRSRPPLPSSPSNMPPKQPTNRYSSESVSPRGRLRRKPAQAQQNNDQLSDTSSGTRSPNDQYDKISLKPDGNNSMISQAAMEVVRSNHSDDPCIFRQGNQSPSGRSPRSASSAVYQKKNSHSSKKDGLSVEIETAVPKQPTPIPVLHASLVQDDLPPKEISSKSFEDDEIHGSSVDCRNPTGLPGVPSPNLSSGFNQKILANIEHLVQKLRQISSKDDEASTTDHIALLCEKQSPDHRYVSEILLASGLLMRDLTSGPISTVPIQLHPSGHPINPDLFLVLEQTKSACLAKPVTVSQNIVQLKSDPEKLQRKLVFDVVNELLIQKLKLASPGPRPDPLLQVRKAKFPSGQRLLREICCDIEHLKAESFVAGSLYGDNSFMAGEDMLRQSEGWTDSGKELPMIALEIERSIFKDLIDEVISGQGATGFQSKASRRQTVRC